MNCLQCMCICISIYIYNVDVSWYHDHDLSSYCNEIVIHHSDVIGTHGRLPAAFQSRFTRTTLEYVVQSSQNSGYCVCVWPSIYWYSFSGGYGYVHVCDWYVDKSPVPFIRWLSCLPSVERLVSVWWAMGKLFTAKTTGCAGFPCCLWFLWQLTEGNAYGLHFDVGLRFS